MLDKTKFIEARASGKSKTQAAIIAGASPRSAKVTGSRLSKNADVQKEFDKQVRKSEVTIQELLAVYKRALTATKFDQFTGEHMDDHTTQMKAADKFMSFLGISFKQNIPIAQNDAPMTAAMKQALNNGDDVALLGLLSKNE